MPILGSAQVWIEVEGIPLPEHAVKITGNTSVVTCNIPSTDGKHFSVCIRQLDAPPEGATGVAQVFIDGNRTNKTTLHKRTVTKISGYRVKKDVRLPFVFTQLWNNGTDTGEKDLERLSSLGTIKVLIAMVTLRPRSAERRDPKFHPRSVISDVPAVNKALKSADIHYTSFGPGEIVHHEGGKMPEIISDYPLFQYNFHYAPLDMLRADRQLELQDVPFQPFTSSIMPIPHQPYNEIEFFEEF